MAHIFQLLAIITLFFVTGAAQPLQDFAFLVDSSLKPDNGETSWPSMVKFVYSVISGTHINCCNNARYALIRYSDDASLQFGFFWYDDIASILLATNGTKYQPGSARSNLSVAIDFARTRVFTPRIGINWNPWHVLIVVTDNLPSSAFDDQLKTAAYKAKVSGIQIVMIGIGNNMSVDPNALLQICSQNYQANLTLVVSNYTALQYDTNVDSAVDQALIKTQLPGDQLSECFAMYAEIVMLLDSSTKADSSTFSNKMLGMALQIANNFAYIGSNAVRFALVRYDTSPSIQFYLNWKDVYISPGNNRFQTVRYSGDGGSNLSLALDLVRTDVFSSDVVRPGVPKIAIIITDNLRVPDNQTLLTAVNNLKATNVRVVAIGINVNRQVDLPLLYELGQNNDTYSYAITVSDYNQLNTNILPTVMSYVCVIPPSPPDETNTPVPSSTPPIDLNAVISRQNSFFIAIVVIVAVISVILILIGILVICLTVYIVKDRENAAQTSTKNKPITEINTHQMPTSGQDYEENIYDSEYNDCITATDASYEPPEDIH